MGLFRQNKRLQEIPETDRSRPIFKGGYISVAVVMAFFTMCITIFIGILTWQISYKASKKVENKLAHDLESKMLNQSILGLEERFNSALLATRVNKQKFEHGIYTVSNPAAAILSMFYDVTSHANKQYDCMQFYLPNQGATGYGETFEAFLEDDNGTYTWWMYQQYDSTLNGYMVYENGSNVSSTNAIDDPEPNYSSNAQPWVTVLNLTDETDEKWTPLYLLFDVAWLSIATVITNGTNIIGVGTVDLSCSFVSGLLKQNADAIPYKTLLIALNLFNPDSGEYQLAGISDSQYSIYREAANGSRSIKTLSEAETEIDCLNKAMTHISNMGVTLLNITSGNQYVQFDINCNSGPQAVTVSKPTTDGLNWILLSFMDKDQINHEISQANKKNAGITVAIVVGATLLSFAFAFILRKLLNNITRDIDLLSDYRFADVLGQEIRGSSFSEFHNVQIALYQLVNKFAQSLKTSKALTSGVASGKAVSSTGQVDTSELQTLVADKYV